MDITTLIDLLSQSPEVTGRFVTYRERLNDKLHPFFFQLIDDFQSGNIQLKDNPKLDAIRKVLDQTFQRISDDTDPIESIINQLNDAAQSLQATEDDTNLPEALQTVDTLYDEALGLYNEAVAFYNEQQAIVEQRPPLEGNHSDPKYKFAVEFNTELERDLEVIEFLQGTFGSYADKLQAISSKITQLMEEFGGGGDDDPGDPPGGGGGDNDPPQGNSIIDIAALMALLEQAPGIIERSNLYKDHLKDSVHPQFFQLVDDYVSGNIQLENNPKLNQIKILLDQLFQKKTIDTGIFESMMLQLADAVDTLVANGSDTTLPSVLQTLNSLYSEAMGICEQANDLYNEYLQIAKNRRQFSIGDVNTPKFNFAMHFDVQLERDSVIIQFFRDTYMVFADKLRKLSAKIGQLIASSHHNPPVEIGPIVSLLEQSEVITNKVTEVINDLQLARTRLFSTGKGFVNRAIEIGIYGDFDKTRAALSSRINEAPDESESYDNLLNLLTEAANSFTTTAENSELAGALSLAGTRRQEAKTIRENAHLLKVAFAELDTFSKQLDDMDATAAERDVFSEYRLTIDKFHLLVLYMDGIGSKFWFSVGKLHDLFLYFFSDQRYKVQQFSDNVPFALLPVRLETRFMTIKHVRDNITYASFSDVFRNDSDAHDIRSVKEINTLTETASPMSGGLLQEAHVLESIPDKHELWVRIYPDNIAIHTHENQLSQSELDDALIYWTENWKATGLADYELGAWRVLCSSYGSQRAAWIISQTIPTNGANPNPPNNPQTVPPTPRASLITAPLLPGLTPRPTSWSQQPRTDVMPERFVVRVYSNNTWREVSGQVVPSPLPVGFDPMDPYANYLDQDGTEINMPPELRWLTDFEEAEKVGMGIRVPLINNEADDGFDRLLVLGLKLSLDAAAATQEFETLINNHHYSTGLALVPQGTPTNNTEETKSGFAGIEPGYEESFKTELGSNLFNTTNNDYDKADGQRLAEALGLNPAIFQHIANSNTYDVQESMAMTRALWPSTLGYYLKNMITPSIVQSTIDDTRNFFTNYVHGRGLIPAFRVRNQPYGVLTSTVYSKWKYSNDYSYDAKLHSGILEKLRKYWLLHFCPDVPRVIDDDSAPHELLVNILGLHPSSLEFHQRITIGNILSSNMAQYLTAANMPQPNPTIANPTAANLLDAYYKSYLMESFSYFNTPRIFSMAFAKSHRLLNGPVIDTLPLSEKRVTENVAFGYANYIEWLAGSPIVYIRNENFTNVQNPGQQQAIAPPKALLYLLLRHAWLLEYLDTAHCLLTTTGVISVDAWHNHELIKMQGDDNRPENATAEQKAMLHGFVKAEVQYENELLIEDVMRHLDTNQEYLESGMTPKQFHLYLRDQSMPAVEDATAVRYNDRFNAYKVEQSQWSYLTSKYPAISSEYSVADYIRQQLNSSNPCYTKLREASNALTKLQTLPTARLERCLAEHLDTCTYRLDSWLNGLVTKRLKQQRDDSPGGIYLGAYGILENPKPGKFHGVHVVNISGADSWKSAIAKKGQRKMLELTEVNHYPVYTFGDYVTALDASAQPASFIYLGDDPTTKLIEDPESGKIVSGQQINEENKGFILAPSLNHAVAAAVMRAGYAAHKDNIAMAVTLSSNRVRTAMYYLDGIRNGQTLPALLGYQFERGLHERQTTNSSLETYIISFREKFTLVSNSVITTPAGENKYGQTRHVTDGLKLLEAYNKFPTTWHNTLGIADNTTPSGFTADGDKIIKEIKKIKDDLDAIGDMLLSESIYQVTRGNHERAGSVLQALGYGALIPEPEIIKTPRTADTFTHRCVVQLTPAANSNWAGTSARAAAEPALNNWLASQLPDPLDIRIVYSYTGNNATLSVDMVDLGLQPIDLVSIFASSGSNQTVDATELSKRVIYYVRNFHTLIDTKEVTIAYSSTAGFANTHRNIFELTPVLQSLSRIAANSRMLTPDDFITPGALAAMPSPSGVLNSTALKARMDTALASLQSAATLLSGAISNTPTSGFILSELNAVRSALINAAQFGITTAIPDRLLAVTQPIRDELVAQATRTLTEVNKRYTQANTKLNLGAGPNDPPNYPDLDVNDHKARVAMLGEIAKMIFGRAFKVFTTFTLHNSSEVQAAFANTTSLLANAGQFPIEAWMSGVARVRPRVGEYHKQMLLAESTRFDPSAASSFNYTMQNVLQFPVVNDPLQPDSWIGMKLPLNYKIPPDAVSMVIESSGTPNVNPTCGMVIDEWPEQIPIDNVTAGIALNYDQPSSEAPQSIILAVTPEIKNYWLWDDLMDTLNETIEMAQIRAVEPDQIQDSPLSQVLPALVAQMSGDGTNTSPSLDFARNVVPVPPGFNDPIDLVAHSA